MTNPIRYVIYQYTSISHLRNSKAILPHLHPLRSILLQPPEKAAWWNRPRGRQSQRSREETLGLCAEALVLVKS